MQRNGDHELEVNVDMQQPIYTLEQGNQSAFKEEKKSNRDAGIG
jgi:hypothetical protein